MFRTALLTLLAVAALGMGHAHAASGTIAVASGSQLYLGGVVSFDWSTSGLHGNQHPRIEVRCIQDVPFDYIDGNGVLRTQTDPLVYAEAGPADQDFLLGAAASVWLWHGGPAECTALLYYWDFHPSQTQVPLASVSFHAEGGP